MIQQTQPIHLLNQVLAEVEAGHATEALMMLSGMLDASVARGQGLNSWRASLTGHPLSRLLSAHLTLPVDTSNLDSACITETPVSRFSPLSGATKMMAESFSRMGFVRALDARQSLSRQCVAEAWSVGKQVALFDCANLGALDELTGRDMQNIVSVSGAQTGTDFCNTSGSHSFAIHAVGANSGQQFDLILASTIADRLRKAELISACKHFAAKLKPNGRIILSAFAPGHLGVGLQQLCLNPDLVCHSEQALEDVAAAADLSITSFRDASNSLIWAELRSNSEIRKSKGDTA